MTEPPTNGTPTVTKNFVVLTRSDYHSLGVRQRRLHDVVGELRRDLNRETELLRTALIELAQARGKKDAQRFARLWIRDHRDLGEIDFHDIPRGDA
jgi:hypothetical protein